MHIRNAIFLSLIVSPIAAHADDGVTVTKLFGHELLINGQTFDHKLIIDGQTVYKEAIIDFDEIGIVDGVPVAIGSVANGGNACDSAHFIVSFPKDKSPRFDGPIENCYGESYKIGATDVQFASPNVPGEGQKRWQWTAEKGIEELSTVPFVADAGKGWEELRERKLNHPGQLFSNGAISGQLKAMVGSDFANIERVLNGVGSGEFESDDWFAQSCTPHMCMDEEAIIFLSSHDQKIYAAWKPSGGKIKVWPPVKEWPDKAKGHLRIWSTKWK